MTGFHRAHLARLAESDDNELRKRHADVSAQNAILWHEMLEEEHVATDAVVVYHLACTRMLPRAITCDDLQPVADCMARMAGPVKPPAAAAAEPVAAPAAAPTEPPTAAAAAAPQDLDVRTGLADCVARLVALEQQMADLVRERTARAAPRTRHEISDADDRAYTQAIGDLIRSEFEYRMRQKSIPMHQWRSELDKMLGGLTINVDHIYELVTTGVLAPTLSVRDLTDVGSRIVDAFKS